jgi:hypothetical protein
MRNSFSAQVFAAGYALDILEERAEFQSDLAASKSLETKLSSFESAVGELAYGVPTVPLPTGLKGRLFDNIRASEADDSGCGDRLPYTDIGVNYSKPPLQNRPIKGYLRVMGVSIQ